MSTKPQHPISVQYLQVAALDSIEHIQTPTDSTEQPQTPSPIGHLITALHSMFLQSYFSEGMPVESRPRLKADYEAIKNILENIELWEEFAKDTKNSINNSDILLNFIKDHSN